MYRFLFNVLLGQISAETAHHLAFALIRAAGATPPATAAIRWVCSPTDESLKVQALGLEFENPLGLAAGFDKDARAPIGLNALGFGFVEVGTVTAQPQPGNPRPRLFRLPADRALVNRMGFNNEGAAAAAERLRALRRRRGVIGVNIGKTKVVSEADAVADFVASTELLASVADYLVVNVSSPNTPGLRALQATERLRPLLVAVREALDQRTSHHVPLLVKIAPDLSDEDIDDIADLAVELRLDGIIATNTTIARDDLASSPDEVDAVGAGGLSGAPLKKRAVAVLRRIRERVGDQLTLVSVGGIEDADDAWERIQAGATLVQAYTAFIYGGPFWARRINRGLAARVRAAGLRSVSEAVGTREVSR